MPRIHPMSLKVSCWWRYRALSMVKRMSPVPAQALTVAWMPPAASDRRMRWLHCSCCCCPTYSFANELKESPVKLHYWKFPACFFRGLRQPRHLFPVVCATGSAFCLITILLLVHWRGITGLFKKSNWHGCFLTQNLGSGEDFPCGVLVDLSERMALRSIGEYSSLAFILCPARGFQCVDRRWLWDDIAPMPELRQPLKPGVTGIRQGLRSCPPSVRQSSGLTNPCARVVVPKGYVRRRNSCSDTRAAGNVHHAVSSG